VSHRLDGGMGRVMPFCPLVHPVVLLLSAKKKKCDVRVLPPPAPHQMHLLLDYVTVRDEEEDHKVLFGFQYTPRNSCKYNFKQGVCVCQWET
jgi:hypothetical protein